MAMKLYVCIWQSSQVGPERGSAKFFNIVISIQWSWDNRVPHRETTSKTRLERSCIWCKFFRSHVWGKLIVQVHVQKITDNTSYQNIILATVISTSVKYFYLLFRKFNMPCEIWSEVSIHKHGMFTGPRKNVMTYFLLFSQCAWFWGCHPTVVKKAACWHTMLHDWVRIPYIPNYLSYFWLQIDSWVLACGLLRVRYTLRSYIAWIGWAHHVVCLLTPRC